MGPDKIALTVNYPDSLMVVRFLEDLNQDELVKGLIYAFNDEATAYTLDWLVDLSPISEPLSAEKIRVIGRAWQRLARGRDVGKRTAYVSLDPVMRERLLLPNASPQYRTICAFEDYAKAAAWLETFDGNLGSGHVQAIELHVEIRVHCPPRACGGAV